MKLDKNVKRERVFLVLSLLENNDGMSLGLLVKKTSIPRSSLFLLLKDLIEKGKVYKKIEQGISYYYIKKSD